MIFASFFITLLLCAHTVLCMEISYNGLTTNKNVPPISLKKLNNALIKAADTNNITKVISSINAGATEIGTALRKSTNKNYSPITEYLLTAAQKRNITLSPLQARMIIDNAAAHGNLEIIKQLLTTIPSLATADNISSALTFAFRYNHTTLVDFLITKAQDLRLLINFDNALSCLACNNNISNIELLFSKAHNLNITPDIKPAFELALANQHYDTMRLLAEKAKCYNTTINFAQVHRMVSYDNKMKNFLLELENQFSK